MSRVTLELIQALRRLEGCEVIRLTPGADRARQSRRDPSWALPGCSRLPGLMLVGGPVLTLVARQLRLDVIHDPTGVAPFTLGRWAGGFRRVVTIHDAIAFRYPQGYPWLNNLLCRRYVPATLRNVDAVITVSEYSRSELERFLPKARGRLHVIPSGVAQVFSRRSDESVTSVLARYGLTRPYVLTVGTQQARKNVAGLVSAFAQVRRVFPELRLVRVGPPIWRFAGLEEQISNLGLDDVVAALGFIPDDDLAAIYSGASAFVLPSLLEGFGLPILEAMACGAPVVCSSTSALPEVAGDAALLVDPMDEAHMARTIQNVLEDPALADELRRKGLARAAKFTWDRAARLHLELYSRLMS